MSASAPATSKDESRMVLDALVELIQKEDVCKHQLCAIYAAVMEAVIETGSKESFKYGNKAYKAEILRVFNLSHILISIPARNVTPRSRPLFASKKNWITTCTDDLMSDEFPINDIFESVMNVGELSMEKSNHGIESIKIDIQASASEYSEDANM